MTILRICAVFFGQSTGKKTGQENNDTRGHTRAAFLDHMAGRPLVPWATAASVPQPSRVWQTAHRAVLRATWTWSVPRAPLALGQGNGEGDADRLAEAPGDMPVP